MHPDQHLIQKPDVEAARWNDSFLGDFLWTSTNFGEALPDVMTPITFSMMRLYESTNRLDFGLGSFPMAGRIGGRLYMNVSVLAGFFTALGMSSEKVAAMTEDAFGKLPAEVEIPVLPIRRMKALRAFFPVAIWRFRLVRSLKRQVQDFVSESPQKALELSAAILSCSTPEEMLKLWDTEIKPSVEYALRMLTAGTSDYKSQSRRLRNVLNGLVGEGDANALMSGYPAGGTIESLGPLLGLADLAAGRIEPGAYLQRYGHRGESELELSIPSPAEKPGWLEDKVEQIRSDPTGPHELLERKRRQHQEAWQRLCRRYPGEISHLQHDLARMNTAALTRERVRSEVVRQVRVLRTYALQVGSIYGIGEDAFYLTLEEISMLLGDERSVINRITARRELHARYAALPPYPPVIRGAFDPFEWAAGANKRIDFFNGKAAAARTTDRSTPLKGFAGSPGIVQARARVLRSLDEQGRFKAGEILVARTTNIGWTLLFHRAAAVVTDVGAPLSHAAIVARELGIPAVVGTGDATARLRTGNLVEVNGAQGLVTVLDPASE